jgi:hypothetical protein
MQKYELSKYDFEALDKLMANAIGDRAKRPLTTIELVTIERLKDRFAGGFTTWIETEQG